MKSALDKFVLYKGSPIYLERKRLIMSRPLSRREYHLEAKGMEGIPESLTYKGLMIVFKEAM